MDRLGIQTSYYYIVAYWCMFPHVSCLVNRLYKPLFINIGISSFLWLLFQTSMKLLKVF